MNFLKCSSRPCQLLWVDCGARGGGRGGSRRRGLLGDVPAPGLRPRAARPGLCGKPSPAASAGLRKTRILMKTGSFLNVSPCGQGTACPGQSCILSRGLVTTKNRCPGARRRGARREGAACSGPAVRACVRATLATAALEEAAWTGLRGPPPAPPGCIERGWELRAGRGTWPMGWEPARVAGGGRSPRRQSPGRESPLPASAAPQGPRTRTVCTRWLPGRAAASERSLCRPLRAAEADGNFCGLNRGRGAPGCLPWQPAASPPVPHPLPPSPPAPFMRPLLHGLHCGRPSLPPVAGPAARPSPRSEGPVGGGRPGRPAPREPLSTWATLTSSSSSSGGRGTVCRARRGSGARNSPAGAVVAAALRSRMRGSASASLPRRGAASAGRGLGTLSGVGGEQA